MFASDIAECSLMLHGGISAESLPGTAAMDKKAAAKNF